MCLSGICAQTKKARASIARAFSFAERSAPSRTCRGRGAGRRIDVAVPRWILHAVSAGCGAAGLIADAARVGTAGGRTDGATAGSPARCACARAAACTAAAALSECERTARGQCRRQDDPCNRRKFHGFTVLVCLNEGIRPHDVRLFLSYRSHLLTFQQSARCDCAMHYSSAARWRIR
jgi:hypothetical protein